MFAIKVNTIGEADGKPTSGLLEEMFKEIHNLDLFSEILEHFIDLDFEVRKGVT